jgi:hypothetical protein
MRPFFAVCASEDFGNPRRIGAESTQKLVPQNVKNSLFVILVFISL